MNKKNRKFLWLVLVLPLLLSACSLPWKRQAVKEAVVFPDVIGETAENAETPEAAAGSDQIKKFADDEELAAWLAENSNPESGLTRDLMTGASATLDSSGEKSLAAGSDFSSTNNQEAAVDEPDIIKTDGNYIYALVRSELLIIRVTSPGASEIVSRISFDSRPQDILISGDSVAVFGSDTGIYGLELYKSFRRYNPYSYFKVFDVSDPAHPRSVRDLSFEGTYKTARLIGDYVYFLTESHGGYVAGEPLVPRVVENGQVRSSACPGWVKCFSPAVYYFDIPYDSYNFTSISAISLANHSEPVGGDIYLLSGNQDLYVSEKNIYITYTQYLDEYELEQLVKRELVAERLSESEKIRLADIEASPAYVLNHHEKKNKVAQIIDRYLASLSAAESETISKEIDSALETKLVEKAAEMEKTVVHKIGINGSKLEYAAMGEVPGQLLNQFSMDEEGDYFRLATTRSEQWSRLNGSSASSYNNLYVLDKDMKIVGRLENLATTERIYAVRFIGSRAYIVTFKQTDPLFAISLVDPTKPTVLNAIKVPGFSNYLHPADANGNMLIGLGRDAEEVSDGGVKVNGIKVALFDFTDPAKPRELSSFLIGDSGSDSIALRDHRAFLYSDDKNILSFPVALRENGRLSFAGSYVFKLENDQISLQGKIDHSDGGNYTQADSWNGYDYYDNTVKRSLYINEDLYTLSNRFLRINRLEDLESVSSLRLTSGGDGYIIIPSQAPADGEPITEESTGEGPIGENPMPEEHISGEPVTEEATEGESIPEEPVTEEPVPPVEETPPVEPPVDETPAP